MLMRSASDRLSPESVLAAARRATGDDAATCENAEALRILCAAFDADRRHMHTRGFQRTRAIVVESLVKAAVLRRYMQTFPEIAGIRIERPLLVISPPRTGTTFVHRLLAQDPQWRWVRTWEVGLAPPPQPVRRSPDDYLERDKRIQIVTRALAHLYRASPDLPRLHHTTATQPEECYGLLEPALVSQSFMFYGPVEEYLAWLDERPHADWLRAYRHYADQVRLLHWFAPGGRWLLKSPIHSWNVESLLDVFPDAHVVQIHRNPSEFLASFCHLIAAHHQVAFRDVDPARIGRVVTPYLRDLLKRLTTARRARPTDRFIDIRHEKLRADPLACVREIYERAGAILSPEAEHRMKAFVADVSRERAPPRDPTPFRVPPNALDEAFREYESAAGA